MSAAAAAANRPLPVPAWDDSTDYSDPATLPWTEFPPEAQATWLALFDNTHIAPYRDAAIVAANAYMASGNADEDASEMGEWTFAYEVHLMQMLSPDGQPVYDDGHVVGVAMVRWVRIESNVTYAIAAQQGEWQHAQYVNLCSALVLCLKMPSAMRDNLLRLAFDRLTLAQINGFGQWLRREMGAWTRPPIRSRLLSQWFDGLPARDVDQKGLLWLKLRAYVAEYLWDRRVEQSDLARHLNAHHNLPRDMLENIVAPMLNGPPAGAPVPLHPRPQPPAYHFPPPRPSQALRNALTGINSEFGGINRQGQPKRPASDGEEEEEEEGPNASAAAAAPKHPHKYHKQQ